MPQKYQFASPGLRQTLITAVTLIVLALLCTVPAAAEEPVPFGDGTYSTAQDLAKALGDTVATADGNILTLKKDINITDTITITGNMTILGDGRTIYRGGEGFFLINVTSGTLTLGSGSTEKMLTIHGQNDKFSSEKNTYGSILVNGSSSLIIKDGVTLRNTTLTGNAAPYTGRGSAVSVVYGAAFTMKGGLITQNTAGRGAVNIVDEASSFLMTGGTISNNTATNAGGGVQNYGRFDLSGGKISGNTASVGGGGVFNRGMFNLSGGEISDNQATETGGGVYNGVTFTMTDGIISRNAAHKYEGGGIYSARGSTFTLSGGEISGNTAKLDGGGVYYNGPFTMSGGIISDNKADRNGGGILSLGKFTMTDGKFSGNKAKDGGGVYHDRDTFTMSGGEISGNEASSNGGGAYNYKSGTFNLSGGTISGNTAATSGGGVYNRGTFTMSGSSEISGNKAKANRAGSYGGGGVANHALFTLSGGKISDNSGRNGAAIMIPSGSAVFQMTGGEISGNKPFSSTGSTIALPNAGGAKVSLTGGSIIDNIGRGLSCDRAITVTVGGSALFSNNTGGSHLYFDRGGTLYLTGGTFKKGEHGSNALDMKNANIYLSGPVTFDADLPFDVLSSNGVLTINGDFTGSIKSFNLADENLDGKDFIKIDSDKTSQKPSEIINRFALSNTNKWTLIADDTTNTIKTVLNKPKALSGEGNVTVKWINATIANVSIRLDPNANDATDVFVKLGDKTSQTRTGTFTKGSTISDLQITGLTPGTTYSVTAVLKNSGISEKQFTSDPLLEVTAPTPAHVTITGEGGAKLPEEILLTNGKSMTFGVLVTDQAGNILKDEPVTWEISGGTTIENEKTATTITLSGGVVLGNTTLKAETVHGAVSATAAITVTTKQPTKLSIEADKETIAFGDTVHLTAVATDGGGKQFGGYTVAWTGSATATSTTGTSAAFTPTGVGSYTLTAAVSEPKLTAQKTITVVGKPTITTHPQSATYTKGQTGAAPLTVSATAPDGGGSLAYQWQKSTDPTFTADVTDLETSDTCTPAVTTAGTYYDRANVTYTQSGITTHTHSTAAKIIVLEPTVDTITLSPSGTAITLETGQTATFTATARNNTLNADLPDAVIIWSVETGGTSASIVQTGNQVTITATSPGRAVINAASGSSTASVTVTVPGTPSPEPEPEPQPPQPTQPPAPSGGSSGSGNMDNAFRVLFDTNGGSFISPVTYLSYGDKITAPPAPTKDGYTFGGWYTDEACTKTWDFSEGIPGDITLYAKWTKTSGSNNGQQSKPTTQPTAKPTTAHETTKSPTASSTPTATAAGGVPPTLTQAPAPIAGALLGLLAAGVLLRRRD